MYNIKGPSKIVAKSTRRGISQNLDNLHNHNRNKVLDSNENEVIDCPKPVFHSRKGVSHNKKCNEGISPQHEQLIKFVSESWNSVTNEVNNSEVNRASTKKSHRVMYLEENSCPPLQDFKPFDLESWWGKRLYNIITNSVNGKN